MAVKTSRASGVADVAIDRDNCSLCGLCIKVCKGGPLVADDGAVRVNQTIGFGCIGRGHCVAVCPIGCVTVSGRDLLPEDILDLPPVDQRASFEHLNNLMLARRSVREYEPGPVEPELIDKVIEAASTAPMGFPPSDVGVLAFRTPASVREFKADLLREMKRMQWMITPWGLALMRPFYGKEGTELMRDFVKPVVETYLAADEAGEDMFFYNAPSALFFYGSPYSDPADATIASTYAMLAAETLGLGTCMLGFPGILLKYSKRLKAKYGLANKMQPGVALILGKPAVEFRKAIRRRFAGVQDF